MSVRPTLAARRRGRAAQLDELELDDEVDAGVGEGVELLDDDESFEDDELSDEPEPEFEPPPSDDDEEPSEDEEEEDAADAVRDDEPRLSVL
jgi:hypothetical protein